MFIMNLYIVFFFVFVHLNLAAYIQFLIAEFIIETEEKQAPAGKMTVK